MLAHLRPHPVPLRHRLLWWIEEALWRQPILCGIAILMLALTLPTGITALIDDLAPTGVDAWVSALKLQVALFLYFAILTWLWGYIDTKARDGRILNGLAVIAAALALAEMGWMLVQAASGTHVRLPGGLETYLDRLMGTGLAALMLLSAAVGTALAWRPAPGLAPAFRTSLVLSMLATKVGSLGCWLR